MDNTTPTQSQLDQLNKIFGTNKTIQDFGNSGSSTPKTFSQEILEAGQRGLVIKNKESQTPNKLFGDSFVGNIGNALTASEQGFGHSLGESLAAPKATKTVNQAQTSHAEDIQKLSDLYKNLESQGKDTTHVKNLLQQLLSETQNGQVPGTNIDAIIPSINKPASRILGEAGGVALDVLAPAMGGESTAGLKDASKVVGIAKNVGKGAALGYGLDVTQKLQNQEEKPFTPGLGTAIGAALPGAAELMKPVSRGLSEISGSLTGQNRGGQKALSEAIQSGGEQATLARGAMRGKITSEQVQQEAQNALNIIKSQKTQAYQSSLSALKENKNSYDISPVLEKMKSQLDEFGIKQSNGALDFSQSPLRFNTEAKKDIQTIYEEMKGFGTKEGDRTVVGLDALKRAFNDLYTPSGEARKFVTSMSSEVRNILKQVPGYDKMAEDYAQKTNLVKDLQQNLSLGNRAGLDTAYKKFGQILRSDTDARTQLLEELNQASGGKLKPMIAGSLAKPILPRGLTRLTSGLAGLATGAEGGSLGGVVKALILGGATTSPRLAGEIINILGVSSKYTKPITNAIKGLMTSPYTVTKAIRNQQ